MQTLVITGGVLNAFLAVFHVMFWKMFNWKESLKPLDSLQRAIMQVLNIHLLMFMFMVAYMSMFQSEQMMSTPIGRGILIFVAGFYLVRVLNQFIFFDMRQWASYAIVAYCLALTVIYGYCWKVAIAL